MNDPPRWSDDEALSALLDGALPADEAERLRARLEREPALARRLEALRRADAAVREAYGPVAEEPLPERVLALLRNADADGRAAAEVLPLRRPAQPPSFFVPSAAAAGIALVVGFVVAWALLPRMDSAAWLAAIAEDGAVQPDSALHELLASVPSGQSRELPGRVSASPQLTFRTLDGEYCREVEVTSARGNARSLACHGQGGWRMELLGFAAPSGARTAGVYRPATNEVSLGIEYAIDALIDGPPLGPNEEEALIEQGWSAAAR